MSGSTPIAVLPGTEEPPAAWARVFDSSVRPADRSALQRLGRAVEGADLVAPPVVLPDFHQEEDMEAPCSIAVATRTTIRPTVGNASVNCGMALIALDSDRPTEAAITDFYRRIRTRFPHPPSRRRQMSREDVIRAAVDGSRFAVDRYGIHPDELDRVEEGGRLDVDPFGGEDRLRRDLPRLTVELSRMQFASVGPSNHFIELQLVDEVLDPPVAVLLGLTEGQLTLMYHAGGGLLTGLIGRMFGRRMDYPLRHRAVMAVQKPIQHLLSARSLAELRARWALYFSDGCPPVPRHTPEGERMMLANAAAMNYGFAFRLAVYANLRRFARESLGAGTRLVVDSPHDTLYEEEIGQAPALVHRYKASRAYPPSRLPDHPVFRVTGQPVLLPGLHRTSSYLCVADEGASESLYSASHGTGSVISDFEARGLSGLDPRRRTALRYSYAGTAPVEVPRLDDRGVDHALRILVRNGIVRPVARLRPLAVLT